MGSPFGRRILIGVLAAGALTAVGIAYADVPDPGGVVHFCYPVDGSGRVTANSSIRVIDPSLPARARSSCSHDEAPLDMNQHGRWPRPGPPARRDRPVPPG